MTDENVLRQMAGKWGWEYPSDDILALAEKAIHYEARCTGGLLVDAGAITRERCEELIARKPAQTQTLTWLSQYETAVIPLIEPILTLKAGYAYYANLAVLTLHGCMFTPEVVRRADELDAVVMQIENARPVIVFANFQALTRYSSMGRLERAKDAIMVTIGARPLLAVGSRAEVAALIKDAKFGQGEDGGTDSSAIWYPRPTDGEDGRMLARIIDDALSLGTTDIAFSPERSGAAGILFRKFGKLISPRAVERLSPDLATSVVRMLMAKSFARADGFSIARTPLDGSVTYHSSVGRTFLRLSFIPLNHPGETRNLTSVSTRLLSQSETTINYDELNFPPAVREQLSFSMRLSQGLILVTGPTNSGKSTTIDAAICEHISRYGKRYKRLGVYDPVERYIAGMNAQINLLHTLRDKDGKPIDPYEANLRAILRHDPDLVSIGEIRDRMTAGLAVNASNTGHLVFSSLHANSPRLALERLGTLVEPELRFQLAEALSLILSQQLIPLVCQNCGILHATTDEERDDWKMYLARIGENHELPDELIAANPDGCRECSEGYTDLVPVFEVLPFDAKRKDAAIALMTGTNTRRELDGGRSVTFTSCTLPLLQNLQTDLASILI